MDSPEVIPIETDADLFLTTSRGFSDGWPDYLTFTGCLSGRRGLILAVDASPTKQETGCVVGNESRRKARNAGRGSVIDGERYRVTARRDKAGHWTILRAERERVKRQIFTVAQRGESNTGVESELSTTGKRGWASRSTVDPRNG
ncbi:hypothetical protein KEM48_002981 [Puccinia striiformis f. sp. tritici PST-130]|nr:hypothetical protein KEM48_002981 [Puccinia striiformis f. sp. tritici PST-130]